MGMIWEHPPRKWVDNIWMGVGLTVSQDHVGKYAALVTTVLPIPCAGVTDTGSWKKSP